MLRQAKATMIHQKAIEGIFKEAWRERTNTSNQGNVLRIAREYRSRCWWEGIRTLHPYHRNKGETKYNKQGPKQRWEDPLVATLGIEWRNLMRSIEDKEQWTAIAKRKGFELAKQWGLVWMSKNTQETNLSKGENKKRKANDQLKEREEGEKDKQPEQKTIQHFLRPDSCTKN